MRACPRQINPEPAIQNNTDQTAQAIVVLTSVLLRHTGQPEITFMTFMDEKPESRVIDIVLGWSFIHGFANPLFEGRLTMTLKRTWATQLQLGARRLVHLIRN